MVQCYYKNDENPNLIRSINSGVCVGSGSATGFFSCCFPWDTCLPSGFCSTNTTYYTALCTDQTLQDGACQHGCNGLYRTGLQYDTGSARWKCCNKEDTTCSTGTNATFDAPAPQQLSAQTRTIVDFIPTSTAASPSTASTSQTNTISSTSSNSSYISSTSSGSSSSTSSSSPVPASVSSSVQAPGLSTGAKAGIGAGVAVLVIALIAGLAFWLVRRRKNNARSVYPSGPTYSKPDRHLASEMSTAHNSQGGLHEKHAPTWTVGTDSSTWDSVSKQPQKGLHEMD